MPSRTLSFSTFLLSKSIGKDAASKSAMTLGFEEMKGPGGMLVLKIVELYFWILVEKNLSLPWL